MLQKSENWILNECDIDQHQTVNMFTAVLIEIFPPSIINWLSWSNFNKFFWGGRECLQCLCFHWTVALDDKAVDDQSLRLILRGTWNMNVRAWWQSHCVCWQRWRGMWVLIGWSSSVNPISSNTQTTDYSLFLGGVVSVEQVPASDLGHSVCLLWLNWI